MVLFPATRWWAQANLHHIVMATLYTYRNGHWSCRVRHQPPQTILAASVFLDSKLNHWSVILTSSHSTNEFCDLLHVHNYMRIWGCSVSMYVGLQTLSLKSPCNHSLHVRCGNVWVQDRHNNVYNYRVTYCCIRFREGMAYPCLTPCFSISAIEWPTATDRSCNTSWYSADPAAVYTHAA